jgi:curved DNA-binding protein CbpA
MAAGAAGQILERTGLDKPINRAAEGLQGAMNNVTQGLSGVMDNIGSGISGFVQQSVQTVQNLPITQQVMEFQQGMRDFAAGITSSDFAQGIARVVMPGVAVLTFATKNVALPVAGFVGREILLPAAGAAVQQGAAFAFNTLTDDMFKDVNLAGTLQDVRDGVAKAPLSEAPARDGATTPAGEQQRGGLVRVENTADVTRTGERQSGPSDWEVLGVREGATPEEMRAALREKGKALHPDANGGDQFKAEQFKAVTAAFSRLQSRDDVQGVAPQGPISDTMRQLSGTTVAPMPESPAPSARGETERRAAQSTQDTSRRESIANARRDLGSFGYSGSPQSSDESEGRASEDDTPSFDSRPKEKENAKPANNIVSARGLRDKNKKTRSDIVSEGRKRAASVARGVPINQILAVTGYEASEAEMAAVADRLREEAKNVAANTLNKFDRPRVPTGPKSRR